MIYQNAVITRNVFVSVCTRLSVKCPPMHSVLQVKGNAERDSRRYEGRGDSAEARYDDSRAGALPESDSALNSA